ncbi:MAG: TonB-dependent receptor [Sphingomonadales bacterium]|nr:TonB-dependent receptor [Sphingomonadales bacterium]MDE2568995.1 TonB-dependent receptor [Sphingomonadales bacterium]
MNRNLRIASSTIALAMVAVSAPAFAQSTGTVDFENPTIVVTGTRASAVAGVEVPDSPKPKLAIEQSLIAHQTAGQTINDTLNLVPGVSFTNNDPFGSLGGSFTIRGFSSDRISQTVDGIPLNDSGNYALYTNQMLDPEIIDSATVSLGSTDVDSPTASAAGGTVNIRSMTPSDDLGAMLSASYGNIIARGNDVSRPYYRVFGMIQTGVFTPWGTKAWFSASKATNASTFSNWGGVDKQQYNGKVYQPLGSNGDFISVAFHYNQNRNNFNGSPAKYSATSGWGITKPSDRFYNLYDGTPCQTAPAIAGHADTPNSCGTPFERRYNPSNTGNIRIESRFTLTDKLVLTVEPSFQYVKANGGGVSKAYEGVDPVTHLTGQINGKYYVGMDLNGDGDTLDTVNVLAPSNTETHRYGVIANLIYDLNDTNRVRLSYTYDRARHYQTGQIGYLYKNGEPYDVFPINDPIKTANGFVLNKRNRLSYATLNQVSAEYRGEFADSKLIVNLGGRLPFFSRDLNQHCYSAYPGDGYGYCVDPANQATLLAAYPFLVAPTARNINYNKFLPSAGFTYKFTPNVSMFASYAKNLSVPGTDDLYGAMYFPLSNPASKPQPETSDSFDLGLRYQSGTISAQLSGWYNKYDNRLKSAYDLNCDCTITRNLGTVDKYGMDGSIAWRPVKQVSFYVFGSWLHSEIKQDVQTGAASFAATAGKAESGAPDYTIGGRVQGTIGAFELGAQVKRTGKRWLNDINTIALPAYTVADIDVRYSLAPYGLKKSYFQVNVTNLFDEVYIGSAPTDLIAASQYVNIGPPRAIVASMVIGF